MRGRQGKQAQYLNFPTKEKSFELVFNQYWEVLYKSAVKKVKSEDAAKDLVQDVFIVYWDNMDNIPEDRDLLPYLYTILKHKTLKLFEKDSIRLKYALSYLKVDVNLKSSPDNLIFNKELSNIITNEVDKMPHRMREIYLLKKEEELSIKEISEMLSLSNQTVKNQLQSATLRLRSRLKYYDAALNLVVAAILFFYFF